MRAEQERRRCRFRVARESGDQIYKADFSAGCVVRECLACHLPAPMPKLLLDVISSFFDCFRATGMRSQINKPLNMSQSFLSRESLPDFCLRGERRDNRGK